jgi:hypothetical protein
VISEFADKTIPPQSAGFSILEDADDPLATKNETIRRAICIVGYSHAALKPAC